MTGLRLYSQMQEFKTLLVIYDALPDEEILIMHDLLYY